ncbi:pseudouridine synthase [Segatella copri]|uniref:pseudouridine synthase n=1 Tax=Segatella copri TaxID=165179 RepID=UPI002802EBB4|nr:pseudouridine synthase [Segatella copri]MDD7645251.1 pseudouridine synthase [Leyella stercorea]MDY4089448.1 pseudouridine synthase [Prevotella sp.]MDY6203591.1 pseudouridine synthase [Segatella copri]
MDSEFENKPQSQSSESENTREGFNAGGYQKSYRSVGRTQRPRINSHRPSFNSDRSSSSSEGGFRPEGFGAGLQSSSTSSSSERPQRSYGSSRGSYGSRPQQGGYNSRGSYNSNRGGYNGRPQQGGYGSRPQQGGYNSRPRFNNNAEGADQHPSTGGYQPRQQGGYNGRPQHGGYNSRPQHGGYNSNRGGGYGRPQQGGYNSNRGGYGRPQGGGYGNKRGGGFRQHTPGYDPNAKYSMKKRIEYKEENIDPTEPLRLNKFLANAGVCSRREADEFIQAGLVTVNGQVVTELGTKILRTDEVKFHDAVVSLEKKVYVLLNKPKDYVTTSDDPQQRKTVMDLVKDVCPERIYPVGRLDRNTTGVLLLTNDGDLASKLTHPKFLKKKVYHVHLDKNLTAHDMQQISEGITLEDGEIKADAVAYADERDKSQVGIEIHSGKNRIVRRIFESLGYRVTKLDRVQFAGLTKKNLRRGDWRFLTEKEVDMLRMGAFE